MNDHQSYGVLFQVYAGRKTLLLKYFWRIP
jgi:hypothetical protein